MVHFPGFARARLWIHRAVHRFCLCGFPHSEIPGSMPACGSPRLIAACHVLHRLLLPRHPPCALSSLTIKFTRHTDGFAASSWLLAISFKLNLPHTDSTLWACLPAPRTESLLHISNLSLQANPEHEIRAAKLLRTPAGFSLGTHKNLQPCRLPNLFSCQISSSPACAGSPCLSRYGSYSTPKCANFKSLSNPMFGAKRLS